MKRRLFLRSYTIVFCKKLVSYKLLIHISYLDLGMYLSTGISDVL